MSKEKEKIKKEELQQIARFFNIKVSDVCKIAGVLEKKIKNLDSRWVGEHVEVELDSKQIDVIDQMKYLKALMNSANEAKSGQVFGDAFICTLNKSKEHVAALIEANIRVYEKVFFIDGKNKGKTELEIVKNDAVENDFVERNNSDISFAKFLLSIPICALICGEVYFWYKVITLLEKIAG